MVSRSTSYEMFPIIFSYPVAMASLLERRVNVRILYNAGAGASVRVRAGTNTGTGIRAPGLFCRIMVYGQNVNITYGCPYFILNIVNKKRVNLKPQNVDL
jgi:hypothetical protein